MNKKPFRNIDNSKSILQPSVSQDDDENYDPSKPNNYEAVIKLLFRF